jgi:hypothetical protein
MQLLQAARQLLAQIWAPTLVNTAGVDEVKAHLGHSQSGTPIPHPAAVWAHSLAAGLQLRREGSSAAAREKATSAFSVSPDELAAETAARDAHPNPVTLMLVTALLMHPAAEVVVAAASAVKQLLLTHPQAALTLLPAVLYSLQQPLSPPSSSRASKADAAADVAAAQAARSSLLSIMLMGAPGTDKSLSLVPLVLRPVKPLMALEAPALARCLALRLTVEAWLESGEVVLKLRHV